jgi:thiol-disulfide isomerase/thioredoxin
LVMAENPLRRQPAPMERTGANPLFNTLSNSKRVSDRKRTVVYRLLAGAPKTLTVAAVVLADLAFNGALMLTRHDTEQHADPVSVDGLSCERGTCQRQAASKPTILAEVAVPTGKPRLLEFTSQHCASCGKMAPLVRKMEHDCTARDGTILPVNVDTDTGDTLATRYQVNALPTFVLIDSNGDEVRRLVGEQPRERLTVALADVNGVVCQLL